MDDKLAQILETLGRLDERSKQIQKDVGGNGQPGLKQRVENLEAHQNKQTGAMVVIGSLGAGAWGFMEWLFHFKK